MDRDPTAKLTWTVTLVPDVDDPNFGDIDRTAFHYGRTHNEIHVTRDGASRPL